MTKVNWDQVDFQVGVIALYDTKNGETRAVPIVPGLMEDALRAARAERDQFYPECDAVFAFEGRRITNSRRSVSAPTRRKSQPPTRLAPPASDSG